jgi:hypothetical protein
LNTPPSPARAGDHVNAQAKRIILSGNEFDDKGGKMQGPLVQIDGDVIVLDGNTVNLSSGATDRPGAVLILGQTGSITIENNVLIEPAGDVPLVRNWTGAAAEVRDNRVPEGVDAETSSGRLWHEARGFAGMARSYAVQYLGEAHHVASAILGRLRSKL